MPTLQQIKDTVDSQMVNILTSMATQQAIWITTHINYWQGIITPTTIPVDGTATAPDKTLKPISDNEGATWIQFGVAIPSLIACSIQVNKHSGPLGIGYTVVAWITSTGDVYTKSWGFGFYADDSQTWTQKIST